MSSLEGGYALVTTAPGGVAATCVSTISVGSIGIFNSELFIEEGIAYVELRVEAYNGFEAA